MEYFFVDGEFIVFCLFKITSKLKGRIEETKDWLFCKTY